MNAINLSQATVSDLPPQVSRPRYDRTELRPGIVHFGVGGFHRAHQAMYLDALLEADAGGAGHGTSGWSVVCVGTMPGDARMRDAMAAQDCLFTMVIKHPDGRLEPRVVGSMSAPRTTPRRC